jgi:hypothetical protein
MCHLAVLVMAEGPRRVTVCAVSLVVGERARPVERASPETARVLS